MIVNLLSVEALQTEWRGVIQMRERMRHLVLATHAADLSRSPAFGDILYNLPCILAFEVLQQVLLQVREEGQMSGSKRDLSSLMDSARKCLPWLDWQALRDAVKRRTELSQNGILFGDVQCLQDIADIEAQLASWGVISAAEPL